MDCVPIADNMGKTRELRLIPVLLAGTAEWLTEPVRARELVPHLRWRKGDIPRYFQVVLNVPFQTRD
jgi:hypothetical protein